MIIGFKVINNVVDKCSVMFFFECNDFNTILVMLTNSIKIMTKVIKISSLLFLVFLSLSCSATNNIKQKEKIRALTTRQFDANSKEVFNVMLDILKDENVQIYSANENTGVLSAKSVDKVPFGLQMLSTIAVGSTTERYVYTYSFSVKDLGNNKTEAKLLIYQVSHDNDFTGDNVVQTSSEGLLKSKKLYNHYFELIQNKL